MKKYNISIIIPLYNCEKYILQCLTSIKNQKFYNYEVIIIDDGSNDCSGQICKEFIEKNKLNNFQYIKKKNGGASSARNYGIKISTGEKIAFIDADDFVTDNYLEELYRLSTKSDLAVANYYEYFNEENIVSNELIIPRNNIKKTFILSMFDENYSSSYEKNNIKGSRTIWGKLYSNKIIKDNKIMFKEGIKFFEDGIFNLEYLMYANKIEFTNKKIYYYRSNETSITKRYYREKLEEDINKMKIIEKIISDDKEINNSFNIYKYNLYIS